VSHLVTSIGYDLTRVQRWPPLRKRRSKSETFFHWFIQRTNVLLLAGPLALLVVAIRYGNLTLNNGRPLTMIDSTIVLPVVTVVSFIMGIVLHSVIADYRESEKIPAELLACFHGILMYARKDALLVGYDPKPILREVEAMLLCVMAHFDNKSKVDFHEAVAAFNNSFLEYCRISDDEHLKKGSQCDLENPQHMVAELTKKCVRCSRAFKSCPPQNYIVSPPHLLSRCVCSSGGLA
jgi:hypothetical protein